MKRLTIGVCIVLIAQTAFAQEWVLDKAATAAAAASPTQGMTAQDYSYAAEAGELSGPEAFVTAPEYQVFSASEDGSGPVAPFYSLPSHHYTGWYRPRAIGRDKAARCAPDSFRPRGFGHLFARQWNEQRMDYKPYVLRDWRTEYGPAYYRLEDDERCEDCDKKHHGSLCSKLGSLCGKGGCSSCGNGDCDSGGCDGGTGGGLLSRMRNWNLGFAKGCGMMGCGVAGCDQCQGNGQATSGECQSCNSNGGQKQWVHSITNGGANQGCTSCGR